MKTIGILGGMSSVSTQIYYRYLCRRVREQEGGLHSPELLIRSVNFAAVAAKQAAEDWEGAGKLLNKEALALEKGGAELLILATNTMHKISERITKNLSIPFLHIGDATAEAILARGFLRPGLIATAYTMEQKFYSERLRTHGLQPLIPEAEDRVEVHRIIYEELCQEEVAATSRVFYEAVVRRLAVREADCIILGCTEVGMLLNADNSPLPVFDTATIHCERALAMARG